MPDAENKGAIPDPRLSDALALLQGMAGRLDLPRVILLQKMATAMRTDIRKRIVVDSDIATHDFEVAFSNLLLIHHATSDEPLKKKSFEYLLRTAFEAAGRRLEVNLQTKSWDVRADDVRYSLKTEAESNMPLTTLRIQKFMDGTWVKNCHRKPEPDDPRDVIERLERETADCLARKAAEIIPAHLTQYDRILMLRIFRMPQAGVSRYLLLEVPKEPLESLGRLDPGTILRNRGDKDDRGYGSDVPAAGAGRLFRVLFDISVGKIRIHAFRQDLCREHAEWFIPMRGEEEEA